jgi:hypothetical protein
MRSTVGLKSTSKPRAHQRRRRIEVHAQGRDCRLLVDGVHPAAVAEGVEHAVLGAVVDADQARVADEAGDRSDLLSRDGDSSLNTTSR